MPKQRLIMAVMVQDDGTPILEYEVKEGQSIQFRVGGTVKAFMERVGPAPDADMFLDADGGNVESVTIEYEHALSGAQVVTLQPGQRLSINPDSITALGNDRAKLGVDMTPYYERDGITIYHGDCLDVLPDLHRQHIAVTDPPWKVDLRSTSGSSLWGDMSNAGRYLSLVLKELWRATQPNGAVWMFHHWKFSPAMLRASDLIDWPIESMLVWDRQWPSVGTCKGLRNSYETVALWCHDDFAITDRSTRDIWAHKWTPGSREFHPAEKPTGLIATILEKCEATAVVDPFMGGGSTLLAAKRQGIPAVWYRD